MKLTELLPLEVCPVILLLTYSIIATVLPSGQVSHSQAPSESVNVPAAQSWGSTL